MRVVWVTGDTPAFEEHFAVNHLADQLVAGGDAKVFEDKKKGYRFVAKLYEFKDIDLRFVAFVHDVIQDSDQKKNSNFYAVEYDAMEPYFIMKTLLENESGFSLLAVRCSSYIGKGEAIESIVAGSPEAALQGFLDDEKVRAARSE